MKRIIISIILLLNVCYSFAQLGTPFIKNFDPEKLGSSPQVWDVKQDPRGVMYIGTTEGLVLYNGQSWKNFFLNAGKAVLSIDIDDNGIVYIGSESNFGYLKADEYGKIKYFNLCAYLDSADRVLTDVWKVFVTKEGVYFWTAMALYRYKYEAGKSPKECIKIWHSNYGEIYPYMVYDSLYIDTDSGLVCMKNDTLKPVYGKDFAKKIKVRMTLPYPEGKVLCANDSMLYVYNPYEKDATKRLLVEPYLDSEKVKATNEFIRENGIYEATMLADSTYALCSDYAGIIIIDRKGEILRRINSSDGLQNDAVQQVFQDRQGELWAGMGHGISRIEIASAFSFWDKKNNLETPINTICKHNGKLYAGTDLNLAYLDNTNNFKTVPGTDIDYPQHLVVKSIKTPDQTHHLLDCFDDGIYEIFDDRIEKISDTRTILLHQSTFDSSKIYVMDQNKNSFKYIQYKNNKWTESEVLATYDKYAKNICEEDSTTLWCIMQGVPHIIKIDENYKLYKMSRKRIMGLFVFAVKKINNNIYFLTGNPGLYKYENNSYKKDRAIFDGHLNKIFLYNLNQIDSNKFYYIDIYKDAKYLISKMKKENGKFQLETTPYKRLNNFRDAYLDGDKNLWVISNEKIYKIDETQKNYDIPIFTIIDKVLMNQDSVIFAGTYYTEDNCPPTVSPTQPENYILDLDYKNNNLTFEYALTSYDVSEKNLYSFALCKDNEAPKWSSWKNETKKDFTNLREGKYTFKVKGKNIFDKESPICEYSFVIKPPWYRTYWAYALYVILFAGFVYSLLKINSKRLQNENLKLEQIVKERTAEIMQQKEEIETIAETLQVANKEIKDKNQQITDSIQYAKRIQTAAMPGDAQIKQILPSFFIFFKPRDIVSGDYYWIREIKDSIIIMAADCTGHGIPGAFMSMLGIALYNEIARRSEINNVAVSLDVLRDELKKTLRQTENENTSDGIDLSVIAIDRKKREMQFAGANNPIFVVQNGVLQTYKADKMPVGIYFIEKPFKYQTIKINAGDRIYMFSDGYIDQFGGNDEFKFTIKRLRELIQANTDKSMREQYEIIKTTHEKWINGNFQMDDILVVGIEIVEKMFRQ